MFEDRVQVPRLYDQWPTVGEHSDDQYALDVLSDVLALLAHRAPDEGAGVRQAVGDDVSAFQNPSENRRTSSA